MAIKYTIKRGDTVSAIAEKYGVTVGAIREANRNIIKDVNLIHTGWVITIPTPETPAKPTKPTDAEVGAAFRDVMDEIENLPAFKRFMKVI